MMWAHAFRRLELCAVHANNVGCACCGACGCWASHGRDELRLHLHWKRTEIHTISDHPEDSTCRALKFFAESHAAYTFLALVIRRVEKERGSRMPVPADREVTHRQETFWIGQSMQHAIVTRHSLNQNPNQHTAEYPEHSCAALAKHRRSPKHCLPRPPVDSCLPWPPVDP